MSAGLMEEPAPERTRLRDKITSVSVGGSVSVTSTRGTASGVSLSSAGVSRPLKVLHLAPFP